MSQIVVGSLGEVAQRTNSSIAESFANADAVVIVDTSGSMEQRDSRNGKSRYEVACEELRRLQTTLPGKVALLSFSDDVLFCPNGIPFSFGGSTDLAKALKFAKIADVENMRFIVVSDGEPNDEDEALAAARIYKNRIDTIFVGPEGGAGQDFLRRLAQASGGQTVTADRVKELSNDIQKLLTAA